MTASGRLVDVLKHPEYDRQQQASGINGRLRVIEIRQCEPFKVEPGQQPG